MRLRIYVRSYHFIANSTTNLDTAGFDMVFSALVTSRIESIGGGRVEGREAGDGGGCVGSCRQVKYPLGLKE